jgi:hypothetical protein
MSLEPILPFLPALYVSVFLILIFVFRSQLKDALFGTLFETVVDGGLSFADEVIGVGLIPGLDIGDYLAALLIFKRNLQNGGLIIAIIGSLEAANFIIGSFIPGVDWFFNILPIYPLLKVMNALVLLFFPHSLLTEGTKYLAIDEKKEAEKNIVVLSQIDAHDAKADKMDKQFQAANKLYLKNKFYRSSKEFKALNKKLKAYLESTFSTYVDEISKMHEYLMNTSRSYASENQVFVPYRLKQSKDAINLGSYADAIIPLISLHQKLLYQVKEIEQNTVTA